MVEVLTGLAAAHGFRFRTQAALTEAMAAACAAHGDVASFHALGESEQGRPLYGVVLGHGPKAVSLVAGAHADEPIGPETLRTLVLEGLRQREALEDLLAAFRFVIVPHVNPDGEARNQPWIRAWPDAEVYIRERVRELPGRDIEFGYPSMRVENRLVSAFLRAQGPFHLHMSLHGMGIAEGALLLIERHWSFRTSALREGYATAVRAAGLGLHDQNRLGEKGFFYLGPGFWTTPEGEAMRTFFHAQGDPGMAARFHDSSMEFVRSLGGDPLCLVTELPLFTIPPDPEHTAAAFSAFRVARPQLMHRAQQGEPIADALAAYGLQPVDPATQVRLQLLTLGLGLQSVV